MSSKISLRKLRNDVDFIWKNFVDYSKTNSSNYATFRDISRQVQDRLDVIFARFNKFRILSLVLIILNSISIILSFLF